MEIKSIDDIISEALKQNASDIHIKVGKPPYLRIFGELSAMDIPPLDKATLEGLILRMMTEEQKANLFKNKELDFSYRCSKDYQFRVNVCFSEGMLVINIRITVAKVKSIEELTLPRVINEMCMKRKGLIIISGTAGSGKTTTLTYMVDFINRERKFKIITIEDPIEYYHESKSSMIIQREVGMDTNSFNDALKYALRQDPDVLVIGEMRDLDSISMALTSAETGHLVLTTVHASNAVETINRIIDVFPEDRRQQIHVQLAGSLLGIISQSLLPLKDGNGRALATEILCTSVAIQNLIHRGALNEIRGQMDAEENGQSHSLESSLADLIRKEKITKTSALQYTKNAHLLEHFLKSGATSSPGTFTESQWEDLYGRRLVIIDRDFKERMHIEMKLKSKGFTTVSSLGKDKDTMDKLKRIRPEIIVLDMAYEYMPTFDYCREIKNLEWRPKFVLIAETLQSNDAANSRAFGAEGFVVKTNECELLIKLLTKLDFSSVPKPAQMPNSPSQPNNEEANS